QIVAGKGTEQNAQEAIVGDGEKPNKVIGKEVVGGNGMAHPCSEHHGDGNRDPWSDSDEPCGPARRRSVAVCHREAGPVVGGEGSRAPRAPWGCVHVSPLGSGRYLRSGIAVRAARRRLASGGRRAQK